MIPSSGAVASGAVGGLPLGIGVTVSGSASGRALAIASSTGAKISHATGAASLIATGAATGTKISLTQADLDAIADAVWDTELETGYTARQMMRIMFAADLAGTATGPRAH